MVGTLQANTPDAPTSESESVSELVSDLEPGAGVDGSRRREGSSADPANDTRPKEMGGRDGPEPTRYGDWEKGGRCIDF